MPSIVQSLAKNRSSSTASLTSASTDWSQNVTTGNTVIVFVCTQKSPTASITSCTDENGNSYTKDVEQVVNANLGGQVRVAIFRASNVVGGNKFTITVSGTAGSKMVFGAIEANGVSPSPTVSTNSGSDNTDTSTTPAAGSVTTLTNQSLIAAIAATDPGVGSNTFTSEPAGMTSYVQETSSTYVPSDGAAKFMSEVGSFNPSWVIGTAASWVAAVAAYTSSSESGGVGMLIGGSRPNSVVFSKLIGG